MTVKPAEKLVLLAGATGLLFLGLRLARLLAFAAYSLGRIKRIDKTEGETREQ
jgi:hypothetical protein